ncbi:RICIN domain-containing protein [Actinoallomurus rhizosphaericola]|uniref:RICIN domain-containing protein n=1 Tax=Actinoallomurus rhizosphaericola TaxID=2952536 RepID=UPI0020938B0A|nr:RICIN domain-containing protein [Actinoallomurus rhizosphaericola]MCO5996729.1 RICIN domain-containing protein [Actinoallomurus rhizosphaericola]
MNRALAPLVALIALIAAVAALLVPLGRAQAATVGFTLGATRTDTSGHALQLHGLGIVKVGSTWYGFGEDKTGETSSNTSFQDIPCYSSTDLATWTHQGAALARQGSGDLGPNRIVERPKVIYNASAQTYVMYLHIDNMSYSEMKVGVATSPTPCGPYTYRGSFQPLGNQSRDIGLFQDTDGSAYLMSENGGHGLRLYRLSQDYLSVASTVAVLPDLEAPAMVKIAGTYYLLASHLTGWGTNDNVYATATSLAGPWSSWRNFAAPGTNTYNSQTANIITVQGSAATTYVYAGDRWTTGDMADSPLIWLPLTIRDTTVNLGQYPTWSLDASAGTWSAGSGLPTSATHTLANGNSGMLMDVSGASTANGGSVIQWPANGGANQQWRLTRLADNVYTLVSVNSGLCLDVPNQSTASGQQLQQWTCNGGANQQWAADLVGSYNGSNYALVNIGNGLTIGVAGSSTSQGAAVQQLTGTGAASQTWRLS